MPEVDEALTLSAQHLTAAAVEEDGVLVLRLGDGEQAVDLTHEIGDPEQAANRLAAAGRAMIAHAERVRHRARASASWT